MPDFNELSLRDKVLLALAAIGKFASAKEIHSWISDRGGINVRLKRPYSFGGVENQLEVMRGEIINGVGLLEPKLDVRPYLYKLGDYTVNTRVAAKIMHAMYEAYKDNDDVLTKEVAMQVARDTYEKHKGKANTDTLVYMEKFEKIVAAGYFIEETSERLKPSNRFLQDEALYIESLLRPFPKLIKKADTEITLKASKANASPKKQKKPPRQKNIKSKLR